MLPFSAVLLKLRGGSFLMEKIRKAFKAVPEQPTSLLSLLLWTMLGRWHFMELITIDFIQCQRLPC